MDALSDLLRVVRLSGAVFLEAELSAPWCIAAQIGPEDCRLAMAEPLRVIAFHYVLEGDLLLQVGREPHTPVGPGALVLLPRNDAHLLGSAPGLPVLNGEDLLQTDAASGIARIRCGGGGEVTRIVCGFVGMDVKHHPLIEALPASLLLDLSAEPAHDWVARTFRYAAGELATAAAGSAIMLAKLSELLFIEAVRRYVATLPDECTGWLAGLRDPMVGRALARLHTQVARAWSTEDLAREVHLSRSAFAERFTTLVGVPPMTYLTSWRMQLAAQRLRETRRSIAQIAEEVGYQSEAAFTRAFTREFAVAPGRWRKQGAAGALVEPGTQARS